MPYSMDSDQNKHNAASPSPMAVETQLIYKIASLESMMSSSLRRLDEKFDRIITEIHDRHLEHSAQLNKLESETRSRFELKRHRIDSLEKEAQLRAEVVEKGLRREVAELKKELCLKNEEAEKEILALKNWQTIITTRMAMVGVVAFAVWAVIGQPIQDLAGRILGTG